MEPAPEDQQIIVGDAELYVVGAATNGTDDDGLRGASSARTATLAKTMVIKAIEMDRHGTFIPVLTDEVRMSEASEPLTGSPLRLLLGGSNGEAENVIDQRINLTCQGQAPDDLFASYRKG